MKKSDGSTAKRKRSKSVLLAVSLCLLTLVLAGFCAGAWFYADLRSSISVSQQEIEEARVTGSDLEELDKEYARPTESTSASDAEEELPEDYIISTDDVSLILLVGSDSREGIGAGARSDSMLLVAVDRAHEKIKLISILRDLYAIIPGYDNNRFNASFYFDGLYRNLDLKITFRTIKKNLGITAEDYVVVDFTGFREIVDILGGITLEVTEPEATYMWSDKDYGRFPRFQAGAGEYHMDGAETLNYCRMRKGVGGDFGRTERQRKVIARIAEQLENARVSEIFAIVNACRERIMTNLTPEEINGYVMEAPELLSYEIVQMQIPVAGAYSYEKVYYNATRYASVLWTNYRWTAKALYSFIFEDDMTYANGGRAHNVVIPSMPEGTMTSPPTSASDAETTASATDVTTVPEGTTTYATETTTTASSAPAAETTAVPTEETAAPTETTTTLPPETTTATTPAVPPAESGE